MHQKGRWAHLFDIVVDASTTLYLSDYPISLTYSNQTYTPYPIFMGEIAQTVKPEMKTLQIQVANIDRTIATYLEAGKVLGKNVTITWIFVRELDDTVVQAFGEVYQVLGAELSDDDATWTFEVGKFNLFRIQLPRNRWIDLRCEWVYKHAGTCDYGRDDFEALSQIDLKQGGDGNKKVQGWRALNMAQVVKADINITTASHLTLRILDTVDARWSSSQKDGPFVYRKLPLSDSANVSGDFDLEVKCAGNPNEPGEAEGILITTDSSSPTNWLYLCRKYLPFAQAPWVLAMVPTKRRSRRLWRTREVFSIQPMVMRRRQRRVESSMYSAHRQSLLLAPKEDLHVVVFSNASNIETQIAAVRSSNFYLRITKIGTNYRFYHRANESDGWSDLVTIARPELSGVDLRIGFAAETDTAPRASDLVARADYFRMTSGGYLTCDRTIAACKIRENFRRIGAAPGIIHGPLIFFWLLFMFLGFVQ